MVAQVIERLLSNLIPSSFVVNTCKSSIYRRIPVNSMFVVVNLRMVYTLHIILWFAGQLSKRNSTALYLNQQCGYMLNRKKNVSVSTTQSTIFLIGCWICGQPFVLSSVLPIRQV